MRAGNMDWYNIFWRFYRTGTIAKKPVGNDDVDIIVQLIDDVKPHQIFVAGDLSEDQKRQLQEAVAKAKEQERVVKQKEKELILKLMIKR